MTTVDIVDNSDHRILDEQRDPANAYKMGAGHINVSRVLHETSGGKGAGAPLDPSLVVANCARHLGTPAGDRDEDPRRGRPREHRATRTGMPSTVSSPPHGDGREGQHLSMLLGFLWWNLSTQV
jgi:hypothetical protein